MIPTWRWFWCCLKPSWRDFFNFMGSWSALPDPIVARASYDTNFEALIAPKTSWLYDWFNSSFSVTFAFVDTPFGEIEMAVWDLSSYISFQLWLTDPDYSCTDPCPYTTGYFALP